MTEPLEALEWLQKGGLRMGPDWERAHEMVHALCHWIEGDTANRDYWYRRVRPWTPAATIGAEWQAVKATLS